MPTQQQLDDWDAIWRATSREPWDSRDWVVRSGSEIVGFTATNAARRTVLNRNNATFMAVAHTAVPALISAVRALMADQYQAIQNTRVRLPDYPTDELKTAVGCVWALGEALSGSGQASQDWQQAMDRARKETDERDLRYCGMIREALDRWKRFSPLPPVDPGAQTGETDLDSLVREISLRMRAMAEEAVSREAQEALDARKDAEYLIAERNRTSDLQARVCFLEGLVHAAFEEGYVAGQREPQGLYDDARGSFEMSEVLKSLRAFEAAERKDGGG